MNQMATTEELVPDWAISPGEMLTNILEQRNIRQAELAERTGLTSKHVNQIVKDKAGISGDVAVLLERALDIPTQFWTRLDADWEAHQGKVRAMERLPEFRQWAAAFDSDTIRRHHVIGPADDEITRVEKILKFFQVATPAAFDQKWIQPRVSFRRSQAFAVEEQNTALWLRLVERAAEQVEVQPLNVKALRAVARSIPGMTTLSVTDGFLAARAALAEAGVVLTFVREVPKTRMLAATWWLASDRPVIGITERQKRPDTFWFNLLHEIGHVVLHPRRTTFLDIDKAPTDHAEQEANDFARTILLPGNSLAEIEKATTRSDLVRLAARLGVGVTIVAGQYAWITKDFSGANALRGTIRPEDVDELEALSLVN